MCVFILVNMVELTSCYIICITAFLRLVLISAVICEAVMT